MATKKREIYARAATQLRTHERPVVAERRCPGAMGLYLFLLLQARGEQTDGDVAEAIAEASWGAPTTYRRKQAEALIEAGLVERVDRRLVVIKYAEHNDTTADIESAKAKARERMYKVRSPDVRRTQREQDGDVRRTEGGCSLDVPISYSISTSGSGSDLGDQDLPDRPSSPPPAAERYRNAYAAGISRGKCAPWVWPGTKYAEWDLGKIIAGHAKDPSGKAYRGAQLLEFIEHTAAEFASDVIERKKAQYYNAFEPKGCLRWLNEAEMAEEARRVG